MVIFGGVSLLFAAEILFHSASWPCIFVFINILVIFPMSMVLQKQGSIFGL